jgi:hypothetical protein
MAPRRRASGRRERLADHAAREREPEAALHGNTLLALLFTRGIPTIQPGAEAQPNAPPIEAPFEPPAVA